MLDNCKYALLMNSLPRHPLQLSVAKQTPLSKIQLDLRLQLLAAEDVEALAGLIWVASWFRMAGEEKEICQYVQQISDSIYDESLREIVHWHLQLRTILTALRLKIKGETNPVQIEHYGFEKWTDRIKKNWHLDDFGLMLHLPWTKEIYQLLKERRPLQLEKYLLEMEWAFYTRQTNRHLFDFPAVALYVLKWHITDRWINYQPEIAVDRFNQYVDACLSEWNTTKQA